MGYYVTYDVCDAAGDAANDGDLRNNQISKFTNIKIHIDTYRPEMNMSID